MAEVPVLRYSRETLITFASDYLKKLGATDEEANITADGMVTAASRWHPGKGQGLEKLFRLTIQCENGGINIGAEFEVVRETPAVALVDGHKGFGYVVGAKSMKMAVEKARKLGIGCVIARHSNHFGQAGYHAETATKAGMIGMATTNALAEMAPWGGTTAVLATSPWGLGIPRDNDFPILLDMALTMSGQGMIMWAYREGQSIPDNWALTPDGRRSTNPADFLTEDGSAAVGTQLPIGEFKGYGLSLFTEVITGVLSGSLFGMNVFQDVANHDVGHYFMALNPETFMPPAEFQARLAELVSQIKSANPIEPDGEIYLPGEMEFRNQQERLKNGIPIDQRTVERLREMSKERGVACPL
jgi:LDH2 family malate/lactate/ureidoglycolate dehydrogenase